ncbi:LacI family DNA-binding transcriptional regulator [Thalassospira marina]|uniref:Transcriptional regulator n=1 Tax=Thalassospira marina TaxID=2048283 RepID=A0ABM6QE43_9PROT|nr:LacI family DNA-binding transcriptional regulator [Thalassospira marina]AUG54876.1 transcriptional regulator [Thalassospira marina]
MGNRVRLVDVARAAGVSQGTASNAFGKPHLVREELREKILAAAAELGYRGPHVMARMLRTGKAGALGVVFPDNLEYAFSDPVAIELLRGIGRECARQSVNMMIISAENHEQAVTAVNNAAVDAFLVHCYSDNNDVISAIRRRNLPMVGIDTDIVGATATVVLDDFEGAASAARHLLECGSRKFAILSLQADEDGQFGLMDARRRGSVSHRVVRERLAGYHSVLKDAGIGVTDIVHVECENLSENVRAQVIDLMAQFPDIDGILAMSDVIAIGALEGLAKTGHDVPNKVRVIGIDGVARGARTTPPLTTVAQNSVEKGRIAAELALAGDDVAEPVLLKTRLLVRASSKATDQG